MKRFLPVIALVAASSAFAQTPAKLVTPQSEIVFVSKQMGVPVEGKFKKFDAQIALDPKNPATGKVALNIDIGSATLGVPESDAELPKAPWFNAAKFPQASFQSTAIKGLGAGKFEVAGKLSIKGSTQDLVVPVT
ncbi:MAG TPA: YceI family protein, partial [Burkholderiaceae bacterium]|nr:YceI family protein [Burkholderiaceae bacterium]